MTASRGILQGVPGESSSAEQSSRSDQPRPIPQCTQSLLGHQAEDDQDTRIEFDSASGTRKVGIFAVALGFAAACVSLFYGIYIIGTFPTHFTARVRLSDVGQKCLALVINLIITICTDGMMSVHTVSLRWALYREHRLDYNTNIRLLTSARANGPNTWYSNLVALVCLILSYGGSSLLFIGNAAADAGFPKQNSEMDDMKTPRHINGPALVALSLGLCGQACIATWCIQSSNAVPTWSSNPLNTTLAAIQKGNIQRRPGRCMLSVQQRHQWSNQEVRPRQRQAGMLHAQQMVRYVLGLLWSLAILAIAWPVTVAVVAVATSSQNHHRPMSTSSRIACSKDMLLQWEPGQVNCSSHNYISLHMSPGTSLSKVGYTLPYSVEIFLSILFVCTIQAGQTIGLHATELLVNLSRDESSWRRAYIGRDRKGRGAQTSVNPLLAVMSSWQANVLSLAKTVMHWAMGQGLSPRIILILVGQRGAADKELISDSGYIRLRGSIEFRMIFPRLFVYAVLAVLLAAFATFLATRPYKGYQPSTFGHLQTIADLVDDWRRNEKGKFWWGDKTRLVAVDDDFYGLRLAGTTRDKELLDPIEKEGNYTGMNWI